MITLKGKKYFHSLLSIGQQFTKNGKIQIEVEKLKWEHKTRSGGFNFQLQLFLV